MTEKMEPKAAGFNFSDLFSYNVTDLSQLEGLNWTLDATDSDQVETVSTEYCGEGLHSFHLSYAKVHGYVSLVVCIFGMLANTLNIIVLTRKDMISPTNAILTGLAVADNLVMIEYIPFTVYMYLLGQRPLSEKFSYPWTVYVLIHAHVTQVFHTISIWLTVLLAVWRYLSVAHPLYARNRCTLDRALLATVIAYVCSPVLCLPHYLTFTIQEKLVEAPSLSAANATESVTLYFLGTSELAKAHNGLLENVNFWTYSVLVKIIPCIALTILSLQLIRALMEARKRRDKLKHRSMAPSSGAGNNLQVALTNAKGPEGERHTDRTTRMLLAVLILFLITEFPQGILALLSGILGDNFFRNCYGHLGEVMDILALINGAINFILYCAMSRQFRQTFRRLFEPRMLSKWTNDDGIALPLTQTQQQLPSPMQRTNQQSAHVTDTNLNNETLPIISAAKPTVQSTD